MAAMTTDTYTVRRSTTVAAPPEHVYEQIVDFRKWTAWSPWEELDPAMTRDYTGPAAGPGAGYSWSGNRKAGRGRMAITEAVEPSTVRIDLLFEKPFKSRNETTFDIEPDGAGSRVTWTMTGRKTLATKIMGIVRSMDSMVGPDFEKGLARLRAVAEQGGETGPS